MQVTRVLATVALALVATIAPTSGSQAAPTGETYADFSMMFTRAAGQHWNVATNTAAGQWAWKPQSATESHIAWGSPAAWPSGSSSERFIRDGDWVRLDGFHGATHTYELRTTVEWLANADCTTGRVALVPGGAQRYAKWNVDDQPYCLFAAGTIRQVSTGKLVSFAHQQVWSREQCANPWLGTRDCLKQVERWWDDNQTPWSEKVNRTHWLGKGAGMAYRIEDKGVTMGLKYTWTW